MTEEDRKLEVYPPIFKLGEVGKWLRRQLMKGILAGTPVLLRMERLRSGWLNKVMSVISFMGEEEFYTLMPPLLAWVLDARMGRLLALLMSIAFYTTGFLKNLLCLPRPPSPPVVPLHQCQDWSLPSHHAVLSASIPWYVWFYSAHHYSSYLSHTHLGTAVFLAIALWSFCVMFSRMYLGVHSPADILCGGMVGCLLLAAWLQLDLSVDQFLRLNSSSIFLYVPIAMAMMYLHPDPKPTTIIFEETVSLMGVSGGVVLTYMLFPTPIPALIQAHQGLEVWTVVKLSVARYLLGMLLLLLVKVVAKVLLKEVLTQLCRLMGVADVVCRKRKSEVMGKKVHYSQSFVTLDQPSLQSGASSDSCGGGGVASLDISTPVRLLTYMLMAFTIFGVDPYLFRVLGM